MSLQTIREDEVAWSLADSVARILHGKATLLVATVLGLLTGLLIGLLIKPYYGADAAFLPPASEGGSLSASSFLGSSLGGESVDTYLGLLGSRTVGDDVIDHLHLMQVYNVGFRDVAHFLLFRASTFFVGKNSLVYIHVEDRDPKRAADIANAYLDALYRLNGQMTESASAHRSAFLDAQLQQQRDNLTRAEDALRQTQEQTGVVLPGGEAQAGVAAAAQLQAQIDGVEARLAGLLVTDTNQNPEVVQTRTLLSQLRGQLARQQADAGSGAGALGITPNRRLPALSLQTERKQREVRIAESGYTALLAQYERARLASIDPGPQLKVVDLAVPAEHKAGPNRPRIAEIGALAGFFSGLLFLLLRTPVLRFTQSIRRQANEARDARS